MPTETLPTRKQIVEENVSTSLVGSLALHALLIGGVLAGGLITRARHPTWGQQASEAGAIQATMVAALPLPPRQRTLDKGVLTSDKPSPAPAPPTPKAEPPPKANEVLIPVKAPPKPVKIAEKAAPEPSKRPQPPVPEPKKATTGETAGVRIPQAVSQLKNGSASTTVEDKSFGERYAYYVKIVNRKVTENWNVQEADSAASNGKRAIIVFTINADGTPADARIVTPSGSSTLDTSALRAVQRVDGFGPLPQSTPIVVQFAFDYKQP